VQQALEAYHDQQVEQLEQAMREAEARRRG
jgi:hypothetical protein